MLHTVRVAHATLDAIDAAIAADGGSRFRVLLGELMPTAGDAYRAEDGGHRSHLGASILGRDCAREVWYSFRWVNREKHDPRILRLFNRGHLEEPRFVAMLRNIGCEVWQYDEKGDQYRIEFADGHGGGSGDGVARGAPDLPPDTPFICEFKTHGESSFIKLAGKLEDWRAYRANRNGRFPGQGVRASKFEHFVQMQTYMRRMGLPAAIYMAVCKNTDDLYAEVIHLDAEFADQFINRGEQIVYLREPPKRINESPGFFKCRLCGKRPVCHQKAEPEHNCRTCDHSVVARAGTWQCGLHKVILDKERQRVGCTDWTKLGGLL